jgi:Uma2 family endonuclease
MNQLVTEKIRWTTADLELLPEDDRRYEIVDGELLVTRAPHWKHQKAINRMANALDTWSLQTNLGESVPTPGLIFTDADNVIPDVVWISKERLATGLDEAGHLMVAPELIVEVLTPLEKKLNQFLFVFRLISELFLNGFVERFPQSGDAGHVFRFVG